MGRQFRHYLLPVDADALLTKLNQEHGLRIVASTSKTSEHVEVPSATNDYTRMAWADMFTFGQYLLAPATQVSISMYYIERQTKWHVDFERSEVIEFTTCDYGADMLREGRLYYQKDMLSSSNDAILSKSVEFVAWAENIFRTAKKRLEYSNELDAYVGREANLWRQQGGRLITGFRQDNKKPIYSDIHP